VPEETVRSFAKEIGAVYKQTSAKNAAGIDVIEYIYYNRTYSLQLAIDL
jgi:hypothetical protein